MIKIYLVCSYEYSETHIHLAFSTRKAAVCFIGFDPKHRDCDLYANRDNYISLRNVNSNNVEIKEIILHSPDNAIFLRNMILEWDKIDPGVDYLFGCDKCNPFLFLKTEKNIREHDRICNGRRKSKLEKYYDNLEK